VPTCLECFCESGLDGRDLVKHIDANHPNFACERANCSHHSPGPVADDEVLAFILIHPLHYDEERDVVVPDAFQELTKRDLSTIRACLSKKSEAERTKEKLVQRGKDKIPPQLRLVDEVCVARVNEIRESSENDRRLLAVYDTALEDIPAHASIFTRSDVLESRLLRKIVRNKVHELFSKGRLTCSDFINGLPE